MIKTILFDINGVVISVHIPTVCTNFANRIGISPEFIIEQDKQNLERLLIGDMSLQEFFEIIRRELKDKNQDLITIWREEGLKATAVNNELLDLIKVLKQRYTVGILSNVTPLRSTIDQELKIYEHFDFALLSFQEHLKKPDPKFYQLACEKSNSQPEEIFYIDDREKYIAAAREFGMQGAVFLDNKCTAELLGKIEEKIRSHHHLRRGQYLNKQS